MQILHCVKYLHVGRMLIKPAFFSGVGDVSANIAGFGKAWLHMLANPPNILNLETVALDENDDSVIIIDQTQLPAKIALKKLHVAEDIWQAIYRLEVRGAPAIGVAAAFGSYVLARRIKEMTYAPFLAELSKITAYLNSARPTAVNLSWALGRMEKICTDNAGLPVAEIKAALRQEALAIKTEDMAVCKRIGERGLELIKPGDGILTYCNAGQLATSKYGTATAPLYLGEERGYGFRVFSCETRPLLQGARLTSFELMAAGVDVTLICDNMAASVMAKGLVQAVLVGADRIAANGDVANKVGTLAVAVLAKHFNIPFYVLAPRSTVDPATPSGADIVIEERPAAEVTDMWYEKRMAPAGVKVFNPAFDVTPRELITAIITEDFP